MTPAATARLLSVIGLARDEDAESRSSAGPVAALFRGCPAPSVLVAFSRVLLLAHRHHGQLRPWFEPERPGPLVWSHIMRTGHRRGAGGGAGLSTLPLAVIAVVAFDQFGGAVANATPAAKRRFHGPEAPARGSSRSSRRTSSRSRWHWSSPASVPGPLAWFAPVMLIKLLLGHLLPEEEAR